VFSIDFDNVVATKVKLYKNTPENDDTIHLREVEAWGTPFVVSQQVTNQFSPHSLNDQHV
jgi:hypothetical protein